VGDPEGEAGASDLDLVPVLERSGTRQPPAPQERPVLADEILDRSAIAAHADAGVTPRNAGDVDPDAAALVASDHVLALDEADHAPFPQEGARSGDGTKLIFQDYSDQTASGWAYLRPTSGGAAVRLGEGFPLSLSADGRWALIEREWAAPGGGSALVLMPTGSGAPRPLNTRGLSKFGSWIGLSKLGSAWIAETSDVFVAAKGPNGVRRTYLLTPDAQPTPVTPAGILGLAGPVGGYVLGAVSEGIPGGGPERALAWYPIAGGAPRPAMGKLRGDANIAGLSADGRYLFEGVNALPGRIERLDLTSGLSTTWKTIQPEDPAGVVGVYRYAVTPDGRAYAYNYLRVLQDLYLIEGVR
jgi:hypothetical protein